MAVAVGHHPWLRELGSAANECPIDPGLFHADGELFYVTLRGLVFLVRDRAGRHCLVPETALPASVIRDDEADDDRLVGAVAEAADTIDAESLAVGWYAYCGYVFHRGDEGSVLVFETSAGFKAESVIEIPAGAVRLDVVPAELRAVVDARHQPVGGEHG